MNDGAEQSTSDLEVPQQPTAKRRRRQDKAAPSSPKPDENSAKGGESQAGQAVVVVHLLAFGDSLTAGGFGSEPYPKQLEGKLNALGLEGLRFKVHNAGICGEDTSSMVARLPEELQTLQKETGQPPAYTLLLGGTNDLGGLEPDAILRNLAKLRATCRQHSSEPVALTIPRDEFGLSPSTRIVNKRLKMQAGGLCDSSSSSSSEAASFLLADLSTVSDEHLTDGVHFSTEGYGLFADLVLNQLRKRLCSLP